MTKVSLREYNRDIENMIEGGQLDEAIVHCQYILKAFPMHVETYRLLGKAFLEARRYPDAADIFQRILMAVPDDFVAHVGMSIIRDNDDKLDEAIWHMERAFEVQPSNPAVQGELRRLYGRRDGVEPPKIRLSRDALANMYSQGELFNQAIAEIRSVLAEDLNRPDLQVMLARAYYRAGQKVEAAEMAATLLKKYPYCMDALRVLVDVLPSATRSDNIQVYRRRLRLLDPYSPFVTDSVFFSDQVADAAVNLERLDSGKGIGGASQPAWSASLGIKLSNGKGSESEPSPKQEQSAAVPRSAPPFIVDASEASAIVAEENSPIPEWMRSAGWKESAGEVEQEKSEPVEEPFAELTSPADIPDWLKAMAPAEMAGRPATEPDPESTSAPAFSGKVSSGVEDGSVPGWLKNLDVSPSPETPSAGQEQAGRELAFQGEFVAESDVSKSDIPDWLQLPDDQPAETFGADDITALRDSLTTGSPVPSEEGESTDLAHVSDEIISDTVEISPLPPLVEGETRPIHTREDALNRLDQLSAMGSEKDSSATVASVKQESASPEGISEEDISITSWLSKLDAGGEEIGKLSSVPVEINRESPHEELPDWLKDIGQSVALSEPESIRAAGEAKAETEATASTGDEAAPDVEQAAPTIPDEWVPLESAGDNVAQSRDLSSSAPEVSPMTAPEFGLDVPGPETQEEPLIEEATRAPTLPLDKEGEMLQAARSALGENALGEAMESYEGLIKKSRLLNEVILDLLRATNEHPVDTIVWQTLGDAYMRANRLQDALDAYTKAEELLR